MTQIVFRSSVILFMFGILWSAASAFGAPASSPPVRPARMVMSWTDAQNRKLKVKWKLQSEWAWVANSAKSVVKVPLLRMALQIPSNYVLKKVDASGVPVLRHVKEGPWGDSGETLYFYISRRDSNVLTFNLKQAKSKKELQLKLRVDLDFPQEKLIVNSSCTDQGISIKKDSGSAKFFFLGAFCIDHESTIDFYMVYSKDSKWVNPAFPIEPTLGPNYAFVTLKKPKEGTIQSAIRFGQFEVEDTTGGFNSYSATFSPVKKASRLGVSAGLGSSYITYTENPGNIKIAELGVTGKVNVDYQLIPKVLDFGLASYLTLFPVNISISPAGLNAARFYGVNGRLGYRLPVSLGAIEYRFLAGYYFWGMMVPNQSYGVQAMAGPQVFISVKSQQAGVRSWNAYVKFAFISDGTTFIQTTNREIAVGFAYQLNSPRAKHPLLIAADYSNAVFSSAAAGIAANLNTYSLGLQASLF